MGFQCLKNESSLAALALWIIISSAKEGPRSESNFTKYCVRSLDHYELQHLAGRAQTLYLALDHRKSVGEVGPDADELLDLDWKVAAVTQWALFLSQCALAQLKADKPSVYARSHIKQERQVRYEEQGAARWIKEHFQETVKGVNSLDR
jgi:hypothetical protein